MTTLRNMSCVALLGLMAAGCVTHQTAKLDAAYALAGASGAAESPRAASTGVASSSAGDNYTAANLFEQARAGYDSPINRFNLAAAYQKTGRSAEAVILYRSVVRDGQFTFAKTNRMNADQLGPSRGVNLAEESKRRLAVLEGTAQPANALRAAGDYGVEASATVGPLNGGRITDAQALARDEAIEAAAGA